MKMIDTLRDEHNGVLVVLEQLERAVSAAERGSPVPKDVFAVFVDTCHHGKEETELFPRLTAVPGRALVERLEADRATGRELAGAYATAVQAYRPGLTESGRTWPSRLASTQRPGGCPCTPEG